MSVDLVERVRRAARDALEETGRFRVAPLPREEIRALEEGWADWERGPPPGTLARLARERALDALVLVTVRACDPYPPFSLSLSAEVHSTETGALLLAAAHDAHEERGLFSGPLEVLAGDRFVREALADLLVAAR